MVGGIGHSKRGYIDIQRYRFILDAIDMVYLSGVAGVHRLKDG